MNVKSLLQQYPAFRERRNKDLMFAHHFIDTYDLQITPERLKFILQEYDSNNRLWRKTLRDFPELRGKDYEEKKKLEQQKVLDLGYEPMTNLNV